MKPWNSSDIQLGFMKLFIVIDVDKIYVECFGRYFVDVGIHTGILYHT